MGFKGFKKMGVGLDGSEPGFRALKEVLDLAQKFGAEVVALHVLPMPVDISELGGAVVELEGQLRTQAETILSRAEDEAKKAGVSFKAVVLSGSPAETLAEYAKKEGFDLLAVGYQGRSRIAELFMGSVTSKLLALSEVPLLVVK